MRFDKVFLVNGNELQDARQRKCIFLYSWSIECNQILGQDQDLRDYIGFWFESPEHDRAVLACVNSNDKELTWEMFPELENVFRNHTQLSPLQERLFFNVFAYHYNGMNHNLPSISYEDVRRALDHLYLTGNPLAFLSLPGFLIRPQDYVEFTVLPNAFLSGPSNIEQQFRVNCDLDPNTFLPIPYHVTSRDFSRRYSMLPRHELQTISYDTTVGPDNTPLHVQHNINPDTHLTFSAEPEPTKDDDDITRCR